MLLGQTDSRLVLAGRDARRAEEAAYSLGAAHSADRIAATRADAADPATLLSAFRQCDLVTVCAPLTAYGPVSHSPQGELDTSRVLGHGAETQLILPMPRNRLDLAGSHRFRPRAFDPLLEQPHFERTRDVEEEDGASSVRSRPIRSGPIGLFLQRPADCGKRNHRL
jgi:hypothetical protein